MSTKPGIVIDIIRFRGDTYDQIFSLNTLSEEIFDLTDCTATLTVTEISKKGVLNELGEYEYVFQSIGSSVGEPVDGVLGFPIKESDVVLEGIYEYDVEIVDSDGKKKTPISGKWKLFSDVNRS